MEKIGQYVLDDNYPAKTVSLCMADSCQELPPLIRTGGKHFVLFLAIDARNVSPEVIDPVADSLLNQGMAYVCVWGPDCERVHDSIDHAVLKRNPDETDADVVITTWHVEDSLEEAVWFFLYSAWPASAYEPTCSDWVAAVIGNPEWGSRVKAKLTSPEND